MAAVSVNDKAAPNEETALLMTETTGHRQQYTSVLPTGVETLPAPSETPSFRRDLSQSWTDYNTIMEKHPVKIKSLTGFILLGLGDLCGQGVEHLRGTSSLVGVDWPRVSRFGVFGLLGAPWSHYYFQYLDTCLPPTPEPFTRTTALKVFIDQFIQAPILLAFMISSLSIMKGTGFEGVVKDMGDNYIMSLIANCKFVRNVSDSRLPLSRRTKSS